MSTVYFILFVLSVVCFGVAAVREHRKIDFLAAGLFFWVLVQAIQTARNL